MNPFRDGIVASPWETTGIDVNSIHDSVFQACLDGIEHVRTNHHSSSLLIHGEAGSGKTHLLRRLRGRLAPQVPPSTERSECLYVWVRLQTSPRMIWRTVRRTLVEDWFRPVRGGKTQFERILLHRLAEIRTAEGDLERWYEFILDHDPNGLKVLMDQIADSLHLNRNTAVAFEHIAFHRHLRDLRAWLSGDSLPEAALARMDLSQDEGTDEEREEQSRQIMLMLCKLAGESLPILISFDQVEALEMFPGDRDGLYAFGQVTSSLHDNTNNVFLVSCVQSTFANQLRDNARKADYDRMTSQGALSLHPLTPTQARQLIAARLKDTPVPLPDTTDDTTSWPLSTQELTDLFSQGPVTPRKLLGLCAERFETLTRRNVTPPGVELSDNTVGHTREIGQQDKIDADTASITEFEGSDKEREPVVRERVPSPREIREQALAKFLMDRWSTSCEEKLSTNAPEKTEEIVRHGLPLLIRLIVSAAVPVRDEVLQDVTLLYETPRGRIGLTVCTSPNMTSLAAQLKRLKSELATPRLTQLGIVRDNRVPISTTAKKARQLLDELENNPKAFFIRPTEEVLAALDALRALLTDAKSGDLSCNGEAVTPQSLEAWLMLNIPTSLQDLVDEVFERAATSGSSNTTDSHDLEVLSTLLIAEQLVKMDDAVHSLKKDREAVIALVRKYPEQIGMIEGDPEVLFRPVKSGETSEN